MGEEATTRKEIRGALEKAWTTATGQRKADTFLDPRRAPNTVLHEMYSIDFLTSNTGKNRDAPSRTMRVEDQTTISSWYRILPEVADKIRDLASDREEAGRQGVMSSLREPLEAVRTRFIRSTPTLHPLGEWYIRTSVYGISYESTIPAAS